MERKEALAKGIKTYDTGRPCANGHLTYRYTQSGTCAGCVAGVRAHASAALAEHPDADPMRARNVLPLVEIKVCAWETFALATEEAIRALTLARYPEATERDLRPRGALTGRQAGTVMMPVKVHPDDVRTAHKIAAAYISRRPNKPDVEALRARFFAAAPTSVLD